MVKIMHTCFIQPDSRRVPKLERWHDKVNILTDGYVIVSLCNWNRPT